MEAELQRVGERHGEQIARLEDLARELILTAESLRRDTSRCRHRDEIRGEIRTQGDRADRNGAQRTALRRRQPVRAHGRAGGGCPRLSLRGLTARRRFRLCRLRGAVPRLGRTRRRFPAPISELVREHAPVLDIGCGRGEFLALLAAARPSPHAASTATRAWSSAVGRSVWTRRSPTPTSTCRSLARWERSAPCSRAQVIEHLPHAQLQRLLELARRKLRPGGLFIAETVNPAPRLLAEDLLGGSHPPAPDLPGGGARARRDRRLRVRLRVRARVRELRAAPASLSPAYAVVATARRAAQRRSERRADARHHARDARPCLRAGACPRPLARAPRAGLAAGRDACRRRAALSRTPKAQPQEEAGGSGRSAAHRSSSSMWRRCSPAIPTPSSSALLLPRRCCRR